MTRADLRFRFLTELEVVSNSRIVDLLTVDQQRTENFLAFDQQGSMRVALVPVVDR